MHYARPLQEKIHSHRLEDDLTELLALSDTKKAAEAVLGRRINENNPKDLITLARIVTKKSSFLRNKLDSIPDEEEVRKEQYAFALDALRAKFIVLSRSSRPLLQFCDGTFSALLPGISQVEAPHNNIYRQELLRTLGPKFYPTLDVGKEGVIEPAKWHLWANTNLAGKTMQECDNKADLFSDSLGPVAESLLTQHCLIDPGADPALKIQEWKTYNAQWSS